MKILICGHACAPHAGSEPGITWNIAVHLSRSHQVWVLTHPEKRAEIEECLKQEPHPNLTFEYVNLPSWLDSWDPKRGQQGIRLHYLLWQRAALYAAKRLQKTIGFDIVHYVSWGTLNVVPLLWRLPVPFIWGPIGGGQTAPVAFRRYFGRSWRREFARNARLKLRRLWPPFQQTVRKTKLILAVNNETKRFLEQAGAPRVLPFLYGVPESWLREDAASRPAGQEVVIQWSGRLEANKGLPILLEAMAHVPDANVRLRVSGRGPERQRYEALSKKLGIDHRVEFLGFIPKHADVLRLMSSADAFAMTSLQESFGSVVLEAMCQGLPVIVLDHQGMAALVPSEVGWKVAVTHPAETVAAMASAIRHMASDPAERQRRGERGLRFVEAHTWPERIQFLEQLYEQCLNEPLTSPEADEVPV